MNGLRAGVLLTLDTEFFQPGAQLPLFIGGAQNSSQHTSVRVELGARFRKGHMLHPDGTHLGFICCQAPRPRLSSASWGLRALGEADSARQPTDDTTLQGAPQLASLSDPPRCEWQGDVVLWLRLALGLPWDRLLRVKERL